MRIDPVEAEDDSFSNQAVICTAEATSSMV
jgi:hypothetical protein